MPRQQPRRRKSSQKHKPEQGWVGQAEQQVYSYKVFVSDPRDITPVDQQDVIITYNDHPSPSLPRQSVPWKASPFEVKQDKQLGYVLRIKPREQLIASGWTINEESGCWTWRDMRGSQNPITINSPNFYILYSERGKVNKKNVVERQEIFSLAGERGKPYAGYGENLGPLAFATFAPHRRYKPFIDKLAGDLPVMFANIIARVVRGGKVFGVITAKDVLQNCGQLVTVDYKASYYWPKMPYLVNRETGELIDMARLFDRNATTKEQMWSNIAILQQNFINTTMEFYKTLATLLAENSPSESVIEDKYTELSTYLKQLLNITYDYIWHGHYLGITFITSAFSHNMDKLLKGLHSLSFPNPERRLANVQYMRDQLKTPLTQILHISYYLYLPKQDNREWLHKQLIKYSAKKTEAKKSVEIIKQEISVCQADIEQLKQDSNAEKLNSKQEELISLQAKLNITETFLETNYFGHFKEYLPNLTKQLICFHLLKPEVIKTIDSIEGEAVQKMVWSNFTEQLDEFLTKETRAFYYEIIKIITQYHKPSKHNPKVATANAAESAIAGAPDNAQSRMTLAEAQMTSASGVPKAETAITSGAVITSEEAAMAGAPDATKGGITPAEAQMAGAPDFKKGISRNSSGTFAPKPEEDVMPVGSTANPTPADVGGPRS